MMVLHFLKRHGGRLAGRNLLLLLPVLSAIWLVLSYDRRQSVGLDVFNKIYGNTYSVNYVLLAFVIASALVVFISLIFYLIQVFGEVAGSPSRCGAPSRLRGTASALLFTTAITLGMYFLTIILAATGVIREEVNFFALPTLFEVSRLLFIGVFFVFLIVDAVLLLSQKLELRNLRAMNGDDKEQQARTIKDAMDLSEWSIWLVNLPVLMMAVVSYWLCHELHMNGAFRMLRDPTLLVPFSVPVVSDETLDLFTNGLDAGVIIASVLISQMVFSVLQMKWEYRAFVASARVAKQNPE